MIEVILPFKDMAEIKNVSYSLSDMLCFLKGYKECLEDNDDYENKLEFVFNNHKLMREIRIKIEEKINELERK